MPRIDGMYPRLAFVGCSGVCCQGYSLASVAASPAVLGINCWLVSSELQVVLLCICQAFACLFASGKESQCALAACRSADPDLFWREDVYRACSFGLLGTSCCALFNLSRALHQVVLYDVPLLLSRALDT
jgi:hypothetical protein